MKTKEELKKKVWAKANKDWDYKEKDKWFPISASEVDKLIDLTIQETAEEILKDIDHLHLGCKIRFCCLNSEDYKEDLKKKWLED